MWLFRLQGSSEIPADLVSTAIHAPFVAVLPIIIHDDALVISVEDTVLVLAVADVAIVVGNDGAVLTAAFVFTAAVGVISIAPEVGIAVIFRFDSTFCGFDAIGFDNGIYRFANKAFHTCV